jgi:uncharacterized membrane protein YqgA involved in biofilm formation
LRECDFSSAISARPFSPLYGAATAKEIVFFIQPRHNARVTGALLNAIGILIGALFGLAMRRPLSINAQNFFKVALGAFTVFFGLRLVWVGINGAFLSCLKQFVIVSLSVVLGAWLGKLLQLQKISNRLGRFAAHAISTKQPQNKTVNGFIGCTILYCAAPLGWLGAVTDGLGGYFYLLAIKAVMDGLATAGLVRAVGWLSAMSAFPVFAILGTMTFACQAYAVPFLEPRGLMDSVNAAAGLITCAIALVIFEIRKVELANYLPGLVMAPLLTWLFK